MTPIRNSMHLHTKIEMDPIIIKQKIGGHELLHGQTDGRTQ